MIHTPCVHCSAQSLNLGSTSHSSVLIDLWTFTGFPLLPSLLPIPEAIMEGAQTHFYPEILTKWRKAGETSVAKNSKVERMDFGRSLTWCWHLVHPANERRATGDPGWTGWPAVGMNVGNDPQLCLDCAGKMLLTQSARTWPRGLERGRLMNTFLNSLTREFIKQKLLSSVLGLNAELGASSHYSQT